MSRTQYDAKNADFSDRAHECAKREIYPIFFGRDADELVYVEQESILKSELWGILDGKLAVDRMVAVPSEHLRDPLVFTFQERFRKPKFARFADLTVTEWNNASNKKSEIYKAGLCGFFLYGYYDDDGDKFVDALIVSMAAMLRMLMVGGLEYTKGRNAKEQDFVCIPFGDLSKRGLVQWRLGRMTAAGPMLPPTEKKGSSVKGIIKGKLTTPH